MMRWSVLLAIGLLGLIGGCGTPSFLITPVSNTSELDEVTVVSPRGFLAGKIAIIDVEGTLIDMKSGGFMQPEENPLSKFVQELQAAADDDSVKAVVLRVNSPGGSVTTSDTMYQELVQFRHDTHKPVVASAQEVMASGAYYVSCGADKIVANPTSIVGSIGVIFETIDIKGTMDKLGIESVAIKSAEFKDMGSPFKHLTDQERDVMQGMVDEYFARFKSVVTSNRTIKDADTLTLVTDGRVFSGEKAMDLGLVDGVGRLEDAIALARDMSHSPDAGVIMYKRPYGYSGSIYADTSVPPPSAASQMNVKLPFDVPMLPSGFYYMWEP
jgi:protease-4